MLCHSIYLQVVKVHLFNLGLPMNGYTFVLPSENQNACRLLSICANAVYNVIQSLKDISSIKFFCKDIHESLKYVDELSELKKMTKFKKNTILSRESTQCRTKANGFSVYLNKCRHSPVPCADPEGGQGVRTPPHLKNHKNIELLSTSGLDPLKFSKLPSQHSTLGHHRHASETPFKCVSLAGR